MAHQIVLVRHGHSEWNLCNRFTGWTDIALTKTGLREAAECGALLARHDFVFDEVHISALRRTQQTAEQILLQLHNPNVPLYRSWRLNERHYGCLQGMNKQEIFAQWGEEKSRRWWRGYHESPPPLTREDPRHPCHDPLYREVEAALLPNAESLQQCQQRLLPYWQQTILPRLQAGRRILLVSHGNTLRSLRMHVENIAPHAIEKVEIPSATPLIYEFDQQLQLQTLQQLEPLDV